MDKRRRLRVRAQFQAEVVLEKKTVKTCTSDISLKGCRCGRIPHLTPGDRCEVIIHFGPEAFCKADAIVTRADDSGTALDFMEIEEDGFPHLHRAVQLLSGNADAVDHELTHPAFEHDQ